MQLNALWQFMQVDMQADNFEAKMRQSEDRQKLIKQRNLLMELQNNMKKLESDIAVMKDRMEAVGDEAVRLEKVLENLTAEIQAEPPKDAEDAQKKAEGVQKVFDTLTRYEQEMRKMRADAEAKDRQQKEIRTRAAKTKADYDQRKAAYDEVFKTESAQLKKLREQTEAEAKRVDVALLERYRAIKQHCTPPMAKLINGQCSGCFMNVPSATLLEIREGNTIAECDNCGRILYVED
ncbi:MAG: hypothetical protein E7317_09075 [Clostridiales bacterium]|nr:hypothetical protein [Clostridiales bacterium]